MVWNDITFVDENDRVIGGGSKDTAVDNGIIHRIVRIIVQNNEGLILLQKRAPNVDVPNKWDQSAAGHVDYGEDYDVAARRELEEEVGIKSTSLVEVEHYYSEENDDGKLRKLFNKLYELRTLSNNVSRQESEVSETRWIARAELEEWLLHTPEDFTQGCREALQRYFKYLDPK